VGIVNELLPMANSKRNYFAPKIELLTIKVEQGFTISNMEYIESENPEQEW